MIFKDKMKSYFERNEKADDARFILSKHIKAKGINIGGTYIRPIQDVRGFNTATIARGMKKNGFGDSIFKISVWPHIKG
jgi:hypothetical protein